MVEGHAKGIEETEPSEKTRNCEFFAETCPHADLPINSDEYRNIVVIDRYGRLPTNAAQRIFDAVLEIQSKRSQKVSMK